MGARKSMSLLLLLTTPPILAMMFVSDATGFLLCRMGIGIGLASFVSCQAWVSVMFSKPIVGFANATAGGWGNLGGAFTTLMMPFIFLAVKGVISALRGPDEHLGEVEDPSTAAEEDFGTSVRPSPSPPALRPRPAPRACAAALLILTTAALAPPLAALVAPRPGLAAHRAALFAARPALAAAPHRDGSETRRRPRPRPRPRPFAVTSCSSSCAGPLVATVLPLPCGAARRPRPPHAQWARPVPQPVEASRRLVTPPAPSQGTSCPPPPKKTDGA